MRTSKRDQILAASQRVLAQRGYHNTTISDIVRQAQVSRATFYLHFTGKRPLLEELMDRFIEKVAGAVRRVDKTEKESSIGAQLIGNIERVLETLDENRDLARLLFKEASGIDPEFDERLQSFYDRLIALIVRSLKRGLEMKMVRPCNPQLVAVCILGEMKEIVVQRILAGRLDLDRERIARDVLAFNLQGLLVMPIRMD